MKQTTNTILSNSSIWGLLWLLVWSCLPLSTWAFSVMRPHQRAAPGGLLVSARPCRPDQTTRSFPITPNKSTALPMASALSLDNSMATLIAFFPTTDAKHQQTFLTAYSNSVLPILLQEPGFVSCHLHMSLDGFTVAMYEQWASYEQCVASYQPTSLPTAVRMSLKYVMNVDETKVNRHVYQIVGSSAQTAGGPAPVIDPLQYPLVHFGILRVATAQTQANAQQLVNCMLHHLPASTQQDHSGLLTSTIHASVDSVQVVNYGQWAAHTPLASKSSSGGGGVEPQNPAAFDAEKSFWQTAVPPDQVVTNDHRLYLLVSSHEAADHK